MKCDNCGHDNPEGARFCAGCGGHLSQQEAEASYPLIGQIVGGRYQIVGLIGEGGMGVVYKAEQRLGSTVRRVAVKTLHADLSRDPSITARFHREVGTVAQLEHPNTVRVYDFGSTDDGTLYIAMEYLDGRALNRVIESEGPLAPARVAHLVRQIAGSLDEAHGHGIIHRDLKPENVLLIERAGEKDVVKLVDFGIAARTESADRAREQKLTQQGMVLGTPPYMSPEQFTGKALDARSDVYSLGVMTYEMLTQQLPFEADTPWQWATHHMTSQPRPFEELAHGKGIPEPLRRAVLRALAKDPHERQGGAGQFHAEFAAALAGQPTPPNGAFAAKTEAMPQGAVPFAMAATEAMPAASPVPPSPASPPVALPPAPTRERSPEGGRGLIYALAGLLVVIGGAMGVLSLSGRGPDDTTASLELDPQSGSAPPVEIAPEVAPEKPTDPAPSSEKSDPEPEPSASTPKPTESPKPSTSSRPSSPAPSRPPPKPQQSTPPPAPPQPTPPPKPAPVPEPKAPTPTRSAGPDPCAACFSAARSGQLTVASKLYAQCTNRQGKSQCTNVAAQVAPRQAERAALNQHCPEALAIVAAARQMGVPAQRFAKAERACK